MAPYILHSSKGRSKGGRCENVFRVLSRGMHKNEGFLWMISIKIVCVKNQVSSTHMRFTLTHTHAPTRSHVHTHTYTHIYTGPRPGSVIQLSGPDPNRQPHLPHPRVP